jgi:hypothetical protein
MVGVDDQQQVQCFDEIGIGDVRFRWDRKHHLQEVLAVRQVVLGINKRLADRLLVGVGGNGGELRQESHHRFFDLSVVVRIE